VFVSITNGFILLGSSHFIIQIRTSMPTPNNPILYFFKTILLMKEKYVLLSPYYNCK
jgi:hypothetical protein